MNKNRSCSPGGIMAGSFFLCHPPRGLSGNEVLEASLPMHKCSQAGSRWPGYSTGCPWWMLVAVVG